MPADVFKIHHPVNIPSEMFSSWEARRKSHYSVDSNIGLWEIDLEWAKNTFEPVMKENGFNLVVTRAWVHFMERGGFRQTHQHNAIKTGLYYVTVPEGSAKMILDDTNTVFEPVEGDFYILPCMISHSVTEHQSDERRWAIAFDCELKS